MSHLYEKSEKYRVVKQSCSLQGMKPVIGGQQGWARKLTVGEVLTCAGTAWTSGDGVPVIKWLDADGNWIANDCEFQPSTGGMWSQRPSDDCLELVRRD